MPDYNKEYREEYLKSMMNRLPPRVVSEIMRSVESHIESHFTADGVLECKFEAREIINIREGMDERLRQYRENQ